MPPSPGSFIFTNHFSYLADLTCHWTQCLQQGWGRPAPKVRPPLVNHTLFPFKKYPSLKEFMFWRMQGTPHCDPPPLPHSWGEDPLSLAFPLSLSPSPHLIFLGPIILFQLQQLYNYYTTQQKLIVSWCLLHIRHCSHVLVSLLICPHTDDLCPRSDNW